jgi:hypothetical protein
MIVGTKRGGAPQRVLMYEQTGRYLLISRKQQLLITTRKKGWTFYRRDNRAIERLARRLKTEL